MAGTRPIAVVTLVNRRARRLEGPGPLLDVFRARRPGVRVVETSSMAELAAAADAIAREVPDVIVLAGGDGSYMAGVTALARAFTAAGRAEADLPTLALAPGGTASTVARNWGFRGGGLLSGGSAERARYASRLLDAIVARRTTTTRRPTLRVTDEGQARIGFIVGAGLVSRFFEVYEGEGARGYAGAARIVARVFAGSFAGGALARRVLTPVPCTIELDGELRSLDRASLVCASVVRDLGLGIKVVHRAGEEHQRFHIVATPLGPSALGPQLPLVVAGRPLLGRGNVDALAQHAVLRLGGGEGAYVLDGELLRAERVEIAPGPELEVVSI